MTEQPFYARYSGATQRARLLDAVTRVVAEKGFAGATVAGICKAAGVSRTTFYEQFDGKFDCLAQAYDTATTIVVDKVSAAALASEGDWSSAIRAGVGAYFDMLHDEPLMARLAVVEFRGAGLETLPFARVAHERWAEHIAFLRAALVDQGSVAPELSLDAITLVLAGIEERLAQALAAGDLDALDGIRNGAIELLGATAP